MADAETKKSPSPEVLVVEDNHILAAILGKILSKMSVEYRLVADGLQAIEACKTENYKTILMDIQMPRMNGMKATQEIRVLNAHYETAPIIAVTANLDFDDVKAYHAAGMTDCIKKPVNQTDLRRMVSEHLGKADEGPSSGTQNRGIDMEAMEGDELDVLNWETLREYSGVMKKEFPKLLTSYLRAGPDMMDKLSEAVFGNEPEKVEFLAHKLKSTSVVFGAESVGNLAAELQEKARTKDMEGAKQVFNDLHIPFERTNAVLKKRLVLMKMGM
jgi:CheY-like chemotaxis protein/HPt (histidine-containing phosphotransfer) domain-containing protein